MAPKIKVVIWINSSNIFDAAVGFGGYRESGFGREGVKKVFLSIFSQKKVNISAKLPHRRHLEK